MSPFRLGALPSAKRKLAKPPSGGASAIETDFTFGDAHGPSIASQALWDDYGERPSAWPHFSRAQTPRCQADHGSSAEGSLSRSYRPGRHDLLRGPQRPCHRPPLLPRGRQRAVSKQKAARAPARAAVTRPLAVWLAHSARKRFLLRTQITHHNRGRARRDGYAGAGRHGPCACC